MDYLQFIGLVGAVASIVGLIIALRDSQCNNDQLGD